MECKFFVGQKVVCVDNTKTNELGIIELTLGCIYEVSWVGMEKDKHGEYISIELVEIKRPKFGNWRSLRGYSSHRFRPAYDIQQFRDIAEKARKTGRITVDA